MHWTRSRPVRQTAWLTQTTSPFLRELMSPLHQGQRRRPPVLQWLNLPQRHILPDMTRRPTLPMQLTTLLSIPSMVMASSIMQVTVRSTAMATTRAQARLDPRSAMCPLLLPGCDMSQSITARPSAASGPPATSQAHSQDNDRSSQLLIPGQDLRIGRKQTSDR